MGCSDEKVFMAKGEFIDNQNNKIGFVEIMQQGNGSNIKIFIKGMSPDDYYFNFYDVLYLWMCYFAFQFERKLNFFLLTNGSF